MLVNICNCGVLKGTSVKSIVQVAAKECGVKYLVESKTIIGCEYRWCGMEGIVVCVCVVWQDVGMVIRECSVVSFLPCLVTFL